MIDFGKILDSILKAGDLVASEAQNQRMQKQGEYRVKLCNYENLYKCIDVSIAAKRDAKRELREHGLPADDEFRRD